MWFYVLLYDLSITVYLNKESHTGLTLVLLNQTRSENSCKCTCASERFEIEHAALTLTVELNPDLRLF